MQQIDYYAVLGISETASSQELKAAYRKLAFEFHPDRTQGDPASADKMKEINEAYAILADDSKRRDYDDMRARFGASAADQFRSTHSQQDIFQGSDIQQIFEEMAKAFGLRGFDEVFREFYGNGTGTFRVNRPGLAIRGFVFSGTFALLPLLQKLLSSLGRGTLSGKIFEKLPGARLPRKGKDITDTIPLSAEDAAQGGPYAYFHRKQSKKLIVKIPPGIRDGQRIRLGGLGKPGPTGNIAGDLYLKIRIRRPFSQMLKLLSEKLLRK